LCDMPVVDADQINVELERRMAAAQTITSLARSLREKANIKVRQPLNRILIPVNSAQQRRDIQLVENIIKEEINIKAIEYVTEETDIVRRSAKGNFKVIGRKFGKNTQNVADTIKGFTATQIKEIETTGKLDIIVNNIPVSLITEDVEIVNEDIEGWLVASDNGIIVALDTELSEELINEGLAREFVSRIQNLRKDSGFEVTDRIAIRYNAEENIRKAITLMLDYVKNETLAEEVEYVDALTAITLDIEGNDVEIEIKKK